MRLPAAFWIMTPLNALFWLTTAAFLLLLFVITLILRNRSERARRVVLAALSILTLIGFFAYKYYLSLDREYDVIFVNGDSNLENLRTANETWKVQMTEIEFKKRMFEE